MRSLQQTLDGRILRDIALVCMADAIVGISYGAISTSGGLAMWVPIALSVLVFAGGAQFAVVGILLAGGGPLTAVATGLLLNTRLIPYGFTVANLLGENWWGRLFYIHLMTDESVAFSLQQSDRETRRAAYLICGVALFVCWNVPVAVGAFLGTAIGDPSSFGLDAAFPTVLFALVLPALSSKRLRLQASLGVMVTIISSLILPTGLPVLLSLTGLLLPLKGGAAKLRARDRSV
jgi:4-azaleucine resistance transporter AzlC